MPSTRSTHTYPAAPPVYSPTAAAPKYIPNENFNASCESKCQSEFNGTQILSYNDEKLKLTRTLSDASLSSEKSSVDLKRYHANASVSNGSSQSANVTSKQCTCKRSLIFKVKALIKPDTSSEKRKTSRSKSADSGSSQGSTISSTRSTTSPITQRDPTLSAFRFFSP